VPLDEGAAPAVLPGQPDRLALDAAASPNANSSPIAQSMPPSDAIAARRCSSGISFVCTVKPSGQRHVRVGDALDDLEVDRRTRVCHAGRRLVRLDGGSMLRGASAAPGWRPPGSR
jgi:hypothetical protein